MNNVNIKYREIRIKMQFTSIEDIIEYYSKEQELRDKIDKNIKDESEKGELISCG